MKSALPLLTTAIAWSAPAYANGGTAIPEPSNLALFGIGLAGLIIGRQVARRRADSEADGEE